MQTATRQTPFFNFDPRSVKSQAWTSQVRDHKDFAVADDVYTSNALSIDSDFMSKPMCSVEEYIGGLAKMLGRHYGLNDIRDAR